MVVELVVGAREHARILGRGGSRRRGGEPSSWAARADAGTSLCPAFLSLKYYIRVERGESLGAAAVIAPSTTHFCHPLVKDFRTLVRRGAASSRGRNALFFFFVRSFVCRTIVTGEESRKELVITASRKGRKSIKKNKRKTKEVCIAIRKKKR